VVVGGAGNVAPAGLLDAGAPGMGVVGTVGTVTRATVVDDDGGAATVGADDADRPPLQPAVTPSATATATMIGRRRRPGISLRRRGGALRRAT
jgi:hypothetical protein